MKPLRISPSQIKRWRQCPRLSAWQLCTDVRPPKDPLPRANDLGTRCHEIAEAWLRDRTPPDEAEEFIYYRPGDIATTAYPGAIVAAGLHHLRPGVDTEVELSYEASGVVWASRADMYAPGFVGDHKFVRSLGSALGSEPDHRNSYGDPSWLGDDPQALIQAGADMVRTGGDATDLEWIYYSTAPTSGRYPTRKVHLRVTREEVSERMVPIVKDALQIKTVYERQISPLDLPPNVNSCKAYGQPCAYTEHCQITPEQQWRALMTNINDEIDRILRDVTPDAPPPPPPPALDAPPPPPPPYESSGMLVYYPDPINPPEAPPETDPLPIAPSAESEIPSDLAALDRDALKALALSRGLVEKSSRLGADALRKILAGAPDLVTEIVAERTERNPGFRSAVDRARLRALANAAAEAVRAYMDAVDEIL